MSGVSSSASVLHPAASVGGRLVIVGAGGFGREVLDVVEAMNAAGAGVEFVGFVDDADSSVPLLERRGAAYLGTIDTLEGSSTIPEALLYIGLRSTRWYWPG